MPGRNGIGCLWCFDRYRGIRFVGARMSFSSCNRVYDVSIRTKRPVCGCAAHVLYSAIHFCCFRIRKKLSAILCSLHFIKSRCRALNLLSCVHILATLLSRQFAPASTATTTSRKTSSYIAHAPASWPQGAQRPTHPQSNHTVPSKPAKMPFTTCRLSSDTLPSYHTRDGSVPPPYDRAILESAVVANEP